VITVGDVYYMFYGDWANICLAKSRDGKKFERVLGAEGRPQLFTEDKPDDRANTRDPMVLPIGDVYYCYYTAYPGRQGAVYCRTSKDLRTWSPSKVVAFGGSAGTNPYSAECPHVVYHDESGCYYLFRTQRYGQNAQTSVYRSKDPMDFGVNGDRYLVGRLPVAAPEIIRHEGQWYMASLLPTLKGIRIAQLRWSPQVASESSP
jgi:sucrose-6-phosphate hydrolase SacC (GH32 family)